jgi:hypothetical protein
MKTEDNLKAAAVIRLDKILFETGQSFFLPRLQSAQ